MSWFDQIIMIRVFTVLLSGLWSASTNENLWCQISISGASFPLVYLFRSIISFCPVCAELRSGFCSCPTFVFADFVTPALLVDVCVTVRVPVWVCADGFAPSPRTTGWSWVIEESVWSPIRSGSGLAHSSKNQLHWRATWSFVACRSNPICTGCLMN